MSLFSEEALYHAYRKAKADLFFERSIPNAKKFAAYEDSLDGKLERLLGRLSGTRGKRWYLDPSFIGGVSFVPKSLELPGEPDDAPKFFASNAIDNWEQIFRRVDEGTGAIKAEFRPMADFTVDMHVVCALWVNHIGERLDACLDKSAMGARLRRIAGKKTYHLNVWQSFEPYIRSYKKWRDDGFAVIRREVDDGKKVVALTMDFRRFFHKIDSTFLLNEKFLELIAATSKGEFELSEDETEFTRQLIKSFETWNKTIPGCGTDKPLGVPVGATASRVIANALLIGFDAIIQRELSPLYYARYVDDLFLVLRDTGDFRCGRDVLDWIQQRMGDVLVKSGHGKDECLAVKLPYAERSEIQFQTKKQRIFLIDNTDLLDAIKSKVDEVSSEWRLLPDLKQMDTSAAARVLSTSRDGTSDGDSLRKADTLLLKRLGFAILLRNADAIVDALPAREWRNERREFYNFALRHVFVPGKLFELSDYLPRVLGIAVCCRDWGFGHRILRAALNAMNGIKQRAIIQLDDVEQNAAISEEIWNGQIKHLRAAFEEAMLKSLTRIRGSKSLERCKHLYAEVVDIPFEIIDMFEEDVEMMSDKMFCRDLGRRPFKSRLLGETKRLTELASRLPTDLPVSFTTRSHEIAALFQECKQPDAPMMPVLFPTRPLTASDISLLVPNKGGDIDFIKLAINSVRGTHYPSDIDTKAPVKNRILSVGRGRGRRNPRIAVTSLLTEVSSWCSAAGKRPDRSAARFERIASLCNAILTIPRESRPHYVLFPELSIPEQWMRIVSESLLRSGISVIAGEEYVHHRKDGKTCVDSRARLFLADNRMGYSSWCALTQLKGKAAHHERDELRSRFGVVLEPSDPLLAQKFIFSHFGFRFGLLICSELTDMQHRLRFRGKIDSLFILSWNQDLESFSALVDAAALDIHCFVALVNNRLFGDSRVRVPFRDSWRRDAVRVKGGIADYFVVADLDVDALRDFQSHKEPPDGPFKPFPEGFKPSKARKVVPGADRRRKPNK